MQSPLKSAEICPNRQSWAERHNLDAVSQSIIYLKENGINSYEELMSRIADGTKRRNQLKDSMKTCQARMKAISEQRKAILTYRRTQAVYVQYRESGWSSQFYQAHAKEIEAHKAAQTVYAKENGKLPTLAELSAEYERLLCQKRADSAALAEAKAEVSSLWHIKTNMDTIASDELIEEKAGITIPDIFSKFGEEYFRKLESEVIAEVSKKTGLVVATGGGAVLKKENVKNLSQNGKIFFLDRPLEQIVPTADRPLSNSELSLKKRFAERYEIYQDTCDERIPVDGVPQHTVKLILGKEK